MQSENAERYLVGWLNRFGSAVPALTVQRFNDLFSFKRQHLPPAIVTARWASDVRTHRASALWTFSQQRRTPTVCCLARAQSHLGRFAFWDSHGRR
jgi:hypothetical protein